MAYIHKFGKGNEEFSVFLVHSSDSDLSVRVQDVLNFFCLSLWKKVNFHLELQTMHSVKMFFCSLVFLLALVTSVAAQSTQNINVCKFIFFSSLYFYIQSPVSLNEI